MEIKSQSLIGFPIEENAYKVDLELQDRYTAYSAEILRLALLGITGYGFLFKDLMYSEGTPVTFLHRAHDVWYLLIVGVVSLGISAVFALQHRLCATECVSCVASFIRKNACGRQDEMEEDRNALRNYLKKAALLLRLSALFLAFGACSFVATSCYILWQ